MNFTFRQLTFQSFGSVGPALNFVALLPLIAYFAGSMMPVATAIAFAVSFMSFLPIIFFSTRIADGSGYAAYAMYSLGYRASIFTGLIYIMYSFLVTPNILMFSSFFIHSYFDYGQKILFDLLFSGVLIFILSMPLIKKRVLAISAITAIGVIEISGILLLSIIMILMAKNIGLEISSTTIFTGNFWEGVMIGVLMFSGSGSGIFLFNRSKINQSRANKTLLLSYSLTGAVMILSSYSLTIFLGGKLGSYSTNPVFLLTILGLDIGNFLPFLLVVLLLLSAYNLMLSYSHALLNMYENFQNRILKKIKYTDARTFFAMLLLADIGILLFSRATIGFYSAFVLLAELVSLCYVVVHLIVGASLLSSNRFRMEIRIIGFLSISLLLIAMIGSLLNSSGFFYITISLFFLILLFSIVGSSLILGNFRLVPDKS